MVLLALGRLLSEIGDSRDHLIGEVLHYQGIPCFALHIFFIELIAGLLFLEGVVFKIDLPVGVLVG